MKYKFNTSGLTDDGSEESEESENFEESERDAHLRRPDTLNAKFL